MSESGSYIVAGFLIAALAAHFLLKRKPERQHRAEPAARADAQSRVQQARAQQRRQPTQAESPAANKARASTLLERYDVTDAVPAPAAGWTDDRAGREAQMRAQRQQMILRARQRFMQMDE